MISDKPDWTYEARDSLNQWYGHVDVFGDKVLGQWFCLDLDTGNELWSVNHSRANTVVDVSSDIIVASETRSDGPWTLSFGCYGISMLTGELLWTSHAGGFWGKVLKALDKVPGFTNGSRDNPIKVIKDEIICDSGRILDIKTGELVRKDWELAKKISKGTNRTEYKSDSWKLYRREVIKAKHDRNMLLAHEPPPVLKGKDKPITSGRKPFELYLYSNTGQLKWDFNLGEMGYYIDGNWFSYRYVNPYVYMVVSEDEQTVPVKPSEPNVVKPNPSVFRFLTLDVKTGKIEQDFVLTDDKVYECRMEYVGNQCILVSVSGKTLLCFKRVRDNRHR